MEMDMIDFIVDFIAEIAEFFLDLWTDKVIEKFKRK